MTRTRLRLFAAAAALFLGPALAAAAQQAALPSAWADEPPVIDGQKPDWEGVPLADGKKDAVSYAFRNDGDSLYVLLVIKDPKYRSTIEGTGVTLYLDATGAKGKAYGILFKRLRLGPEEYIAHLEKRGPLSEDDKAGIRRKAGFYLFHHQVLDRKGKPVEAANGAGSRPAVFKYAADGPALVYEFSVPLARAADSAAGVGAAPGAAVAVGFAWGGETEEMRKAAARRLREGAHTANEEVGGGLGGQSLESGPRGAGPVAKKPASPKRYAFWTTVKLAAGPA